MEHLHTDLLHTWLFNNLRHDYWCIRAIWNSSDARGLNALVVSEVDGLMQHIYLPSSSWQLSPAPKRVV